MNTTTEVKVMVPICHKSNADKSGEFPLELFAITRDASITLLPHSAIRDKGADLVRQWRQAECNLLSWRGHGGVKTAPGFDKKGNGWKPGVSASTKWEVGGRFAEFVLSMRKERDREIMACAPADVTGLCLVGKDGAFLRAFLGMVGNPKEAMRHADIAEMELAIITTDCKHVSEIPANYAPHWNGDKWTLKHKVHKSRPSMGDGNPRHGSKGTLPDAGVTVPPENVADAINTLIDAKLEKGRGKRKRK